MKIKQSDMDIIYITEHAEDLWLRFRWKDGIPICPYCQASQKQYKCIDCRYKCNCCNRRYSSRVRTIFQNSKLSIQKIVLAIYHVLSTEAVSAISIARFIGVSYDTGWLFMKRLQYATLQETAITGIVALDEVYLGSRWRNIHWKKKLEILHDYRIIPPEKERFTLSEAGQARDAYKMPVLGGTDGTRVFLQCLQNQFTSTDIQDLMQRFVQDAKMIVTDDSSLYNFLSDNHEINCHSHKQYTSKKGYSSNSIEGVFSHFKRRFRYATVHCKDCYMQLYLNLFVAKWNIRNCTMEECFGSIFGYITTGKTCRVKDIKECTKQSGKKELIRAKQQKKKEDIECMQKYINDNQEFIKSIEVNGQTLCPQHNPSAKL